MKPLVINNFYPKKLTLLGVIMLLKLWIMIMTIFSLSSAYASERPGKLANEVNPGSLEVVQLGGAKPEKKLEMPLQHTDVQIEVSGFVAQATVTQRYHNPFTKPIEAVYTFPLPEDAAVDDLQMTIGNRIIKGLIKRRDEARKIYEKARDEGKRASLLEQERPNIFTQSVANIMPGDNIVITIRYVNILHYSDGNYELVFPMVVGPRYIPGEVAVGQQGTGTVPDTNVVPDASKITPPVLKPGERTGHDISLAVKLDAGVPIQGIESPSHVIDKKTVSSREQEIKLHPADTIPNKDFILRYQVAGQVPEVAVIAHHDERGGFFTLIIQPQRQMSDEQVVPRELIFIVDTSGSMNGFPVEKSKEAMRKLIKGMRATDTFNVVRFAGDTGTLWESPKPYTSANAEQALKYVDTFQGSGGTEMQKGIFEALAQPAAEGYLRIAFLLTDGYVGDEFRILQTIEKEKRGARIFSLGVGSSVNRYLLDRAAAVGLGEAFYVRQDEDSTGVIDKFFTRVDKPALAHVSINWGDLDVNRLYPSRIPDLWAGQPVRVHGRYTKGGDAEIVVSGQLGKQPYQQKVRIRLPQNQSAHEAMATVWARQKVQELMDNMVKEGQTPKLIEEVTQTGLTFRLMTQWTSFVAVEEKVVNVEGKPQTVVQPVELPEGVSYEGVFGDEDQSPVAVRNGAKSYAPSLQAPGRALLRPSLDASVGGQAELSADFAPSEPQVVAAPAPAENEVREEKKDKGAAEVAKKERDQKERSLEVLFAAGQAVLSDEAKKLLDQWLVDICKNLDQIREIELVGHTDNSPADNYKQKLSLERAIAVADYLVKQCPALSRDKLITKGEADKQPIDSNETEEGRAKNRRVVIRVVQK